MSSGPAERALLAGRGSFALTNRVSCLEGKPRALRGVNAGDRGPGVRYLTLRK